MEIIFSYKEIFEHINANVFYAIADKKSGELKYFKFLKFKSYSKWEQDKFNAEFVKNMIYKEDLSLFYKAFKEAGERGYAEVVFRFITKDKKFVFIKSKLSLIHSDNENLYIIGTNENVSKEKEYEIIVETLKNSPHIGILVFQERIKYFNKYISSLIDIKVGDELFKYIKNLPKKEMEDLILRRKSGENIFIYRREVEVVNKKRVFVDAFVQTVIFEGEYCGLALVTNVTNYKKISIIDNIISQISDNLFEKLNKEKFLELVKSIVEKWGYKIYIDVEGVKIGKKPPLIPDGMIYNQLDGDYKSFLKIEVGNGFIVIYSEFFEEFEEELITHYKELQKSIRFSLINIEHTMLLTILKEAIDKSYQWVVITDENRNIIYVNDIVSTLSGYDKDFIIGKTPKIFRSNYHDESFYKRLLDTLKSGKIFEEIFVDKKKNGKLFYLKSKIIPIHINGETYYVSLGIDITREKKLQESLLTDEVTSLLNRKGFLLEAQKSIKEKSALLLIDIRNFKAINQIKGYVYGNLILKEFANLLKRTFFNKGVIGKIGGDEFAVLVPYSSLKDVLEVVENLIKEARKIENLDINVGIALYKKDSSELPELLEKAISALEYAKKEGAGVYKFYNEEIEKEVASLLNAKFLISDALNNDKFEYFFQPYYSLKDEKIVGFEALLRIVDNDKIYSPFYFIDYAEESGLIKDIELHMYKKLPDIYKQLNSHLSVNLSLASFYTDIHIKTLLSFIKGLPLSLELTERTIGKNIEFTQEILSLIKEFGLEVAIDDFGTGYSSFIYIKELEFDILKIDISFIKNIEHSPKDLAIVRYLISLSKELGVKTIAEGVETKRQLQILKELGCDIVQGYLISKPLPLKEAISFKKNFKGV